MERHYCSYSNALGYLVQLSRHIEILTSPRSSGTTQVLETTQKAEPKLHAGSEDYRHQLPLPPPSVEVNRHNMLPLPENQFPVDHWHRQARLEQRGAHVRKSIPVAPAQVVSILGLSAGEPPFTGPRRGRSSRDARPTRPMRCTYASGAKGTS